MRRLSLDMVQPGMVLAKAILGSTGQVLLKAGAEIRPQYLTYFRRLGISSLYVKDSRLEDVSVDDHIREETRHEARLLVKKTMQDVKITGSNRKGINIQNGELIRLVAKLIDELLEKKDMIVQLTDIRTKGEYLFAHSVNCSVLAAIVGSQMNYTRKSLQALAAGTLLHDLGMVSLPEPVLGKPGSLTEEEFEMVKEHAVYGYQVFKHTTLFSEEASHVILQHHERCQGQGYPLGLTGGDISELAQIAGIVDVYDALTSDRPQRKAYKPHQAVEMLISWGGDYFDIHILNCFLSIIAAYPIGFRVLLSNGESGLVTANNPGLTTRPVVRVLYAGEGLAPHPAPYDLDLAESLDVTIVKVLDF